MKRTGTVAALRVALLIGIVAPMSASAADPFGQNLIVNGNAEANTGSTDGSVISPITGFTTTGGFTVVQYAAGGGFPTATDPGPVDRGFNFFAGGPTVALSTGSQVIDVSSASSLIDAGNVAFDLAAFLGGFSSQRDNAVLTASFLNAASSQIGSASIGPVSNTDRNNATGLLLREDTGVVPLGTRSVQVTLTLTRIDGSYDDGYADNLSLVLTPVPEPSAVLQMVLAVGAIVGVRAVSRRRNSRGLGTTI